MSDRAANPWEGIEPHPDFRVLFVRHAESQISIMPELEIPRHALPARQRGDLSPDQERNAAGQSDRGRAGRRTT